MDTSEIVLPPSPADGAAAKTHGIDPFIALLRAADRGLSPLLGRRGSLALLRRTLALGRQRFGWLHAAPASHDFDQTTAGLRASLVGRPADEAGVAASALESTFRDLLSSLIGGGLAGQVLGAAADPHGDAGTDLARDRCAS